MVQYSVLLSIDSVLFYYMASSISRKDELNPKL